MSTRRKPGDIVRKTADSGFVGDAGGLWRIEAQGAEPCLGFNGCEDVECQEWATLWEIGPDGLPTGRAAFHVSECEMVDAGGS